MRKEERLKTYHACLRPWGQASNMTGDDKISRTKNFHFLEEKRDESEDQVSGLICLHIPLVAHHSSDLNGYKRRSFLCNSFLTFSKREGIMMYGLDPFWWVPYE